MVGLAMMLALTACLGTPMPVVTPHDDPATEQALRDAWLPDAEGMRLRARLVLELDGDQSTSTLLAYLAGPDSARVVGLSDTGPTVFDAVCVRGEVHFEKEPGLLPAAVVKALVRDLASLVLPGPDGALTLVSQESGEPALWHADPWRELLVVTRDEGVAHAIVGEERRERARAELLQWTGTDPWRHPARITLDADGYRAELDISEWRDAAVRPELFEGPDS